MPVLVTAADTPLGTLLVHHLLATGGQVRAYCSAGGDVRELRTAGAITATGDLDDEGRLEAACEQVHTVIHLGGGLLSPSAEQLVADAATVATATANAGVRRVVALSVVGAFAGANDPLRRAKAVTEDLFATSVPPSVVLRVPVIATPGLGTVLAGTPLPPELAEHPVRTVRAEEVVALLLALDDLRSEREDGHAVLVAQGGPEVPLRTLVPSSGSATYRPVDAVPLLLAGLAGDWTDHDSSAADAWGFTAVDRAAI